MKELETILIQNFTTTIELAVISTTKGMEEMLTDSTPRQSVNVNVVSTIHCRVSVKCQILIFVCCLLKHHLPEIHSPVSPSVINFQFS